MDEQDAFDSSDARRWPKKPLGDLITAPQKTGISKPASDESSIRCLTLSAVRNGELDLSAYKTVNVSEEAAAGNWVLPGYFYVVRGNGNRSLVGRGAFAPSVVNPPVLYPDLLIQVAWNPAMVHPLYIRWAWDCPDVRADIEGRARTAAGIFKINQRNLAAVRVPIPPLAEQQRLATVLQEQMAAVERARVAAEARCEAIGALMISYVRRSLKSGNVRRVSLGDCLSEIRSGVGSSWSSYPLIGATREGLAPAKERIGKHPEKYKLVDNGTVFYNPMRIIIGSIAIVDDGDPPGITSPDYVVLKGKPGILDTRWFYHWFRSPYGSNLIDSLSRGAVRERILFNRLAAGEIELPSIADQRSASAKLKELRRLRMLSSAESAAVSALPAAILQLVFKGAL